MSQQYDYPPPPPTLNAHDGAGGLPLHARRPQTAVSPSLTTNFLRAHGAIGVPSPSTPSPPPPPPAVSANTPFPYSPSTPSALNPARSPSALHPGSAAHSSSSPNMAQSYNPRQWQQMGHGSTSHMTFRQSSRPPSDTRDVTGMEAAMPSPPPPYSPDAPDVASAGRQSMIMDSTAFMASPLVGTFSASPEPAPSFAPPPGQASRHRERSSSGLAGRLANFANRNRLQTSGDAQQNSPTVVSPQPMPPAARRAASTGTVPSAATTASPTPLGRASPDPSRWQPGMPLPPPPPGPPPPGARSQSLNRVPAGSSSSSAMGTGTQLFDDAPVRRRAQAPSLGTVPPTPADWREGDAMQSAPDLHDDPWPTAQHVSPSFQPLHIETGSSARETSLSRRPARRDTSALRERRSRSRAAKEARDSMAQPSSDDSKPSDLILGPSGGSISRRREHARTGSGYAGRSPTMHSHRSPLSASQTQTANTILTPPYTPAVRNQSAGLNQKRPLQPPSSATSDRLASNSLHTPNDELQSQAPVSPARAMSRPPSSSSLQSSKLDAFAMQAVERHRKFVEQEAAAASDEERLELFATYIVHESRLRRDRYYTAYNAMAADIGDLTRDMWRSYQRENKRAVTPSTSMSSFDQTLPSWASDGQPTSAHGGMPSSATSLDNLTPATDSASFGDPGEGLDRSEGKQWDKAFKPSLSPIPSMAQSSVQDDRSSRGRTQSRWWESESGSIGKPDRIERSRRETKYMGVNPAMLADDPEPSPANTRSTPTPGASFQNFLSTEISSDEYPPEKVGWHEGDDFSTPMATPAHQRPRKSSTPGIGPLDVSRLVTLPPPYPRHHPAVNNSHPLLADLRNEHRALADTDDIDNVKERYEKEASGAKHNLEEAARERKQQQRVVIQENVMSGKLSFAGAARAEAEFEASEGQRSKANAKAQFDMFESSLAHPLNAILSERIGRADNCIRELRADLETRNQQSTPDQTQEEGDETPERLEKLTLLKWLFETRELLHKELFSLHGKRSEMYSEVVLAPYRAANDTAKVDEISAFFQKDGQERNITYAKDSQKRFEVLQKHIDHNVSRGVEDQLSAFWDIAPGLLQVIQRVPPELSGFEVFVPPEEYEENPSYHDHPLQYLYTVLSHAEKSTYQFIESETNLLCLLHEVRTAITKSNLKRIEMERLAASPEDAELKDKMRQARRDEEDRLTKDLQDKVGEVERQWREALGDGLEDVKMRVRSWLEENGGWDDALEE